MTSARQRHSSRLVADTPPAFGVRVETQASVILVDHMQMHVCSIAEHDSVCRGEAD